MTQDSADRFSLRETSPATVAAFPRSLRLLYVGPNQPSWVHLALQLDADGCAEPRFQWVSTSHETLMLLRDESYDCIVICSRIERNAGDWIDGAELLGAIRASGCDDPVILLAPEATDSDWAAFCGLSCEVLISPNLWESPALVPMIKRALHNVEIARENQRLSVRQQRRHLRERDEAEHLLLQQRQILGALEGLLEVSDAGRESARLDAEGSATRPKLALPQQVSDYYHELLRTYVIMGSGNLGREIAELAELIALAELSPRKALSLHLERVECLVRGLGSRSCRHVMSRADLLALELMMHLGECYQRRRSTGISG